MPRFIQDLALCASVANLCFLQSWHEFAKLQSAQTAYWRGTPPDGSVLAVLLANIGLLTLALFAGISLTRRWAPLLRPAKAVLVLLFILPVNSLRLQVGEQLEEARTAVDMLFFLGEVALLGATVAVLLGRAGGVARTIRGAVRVATPLLPITLAWAAWSQWNGFPDVAYANRSSAAEISVRDG
ncbi:MAG: hypothetical protein GY824_04705, partial [Delftia sp.]|nr:hypothetical protein [Delftia sp.]